jgi:FkbM family methyltransferase
MNYLSQAGQDKWVADFFHEKRNGYFVDIGAYDGLDISNTYVLEKEFGWTGVCIEPSIRMFKKLRNNRGCRLVNRAAYNRNEIVNFDDIGVSSLITGAGKHRVWANTMSAILIDVNAPLVIDYISLDTEGTEYEVLQGFPFDKYEVILWTVEHNICYKDKQHFDLKRNIFSILTAHHYTRVQEDVLCNGDPQYPFEDWYVNNKYL